MGSAFFLKVSHVKLKKLREKSHCFMASNILKNNTFGGNNTSISTNVSNLPGQYLPRWLANYYL